VRLEGLGKLKSQMTSSGLKPATFWLVAQCLRQLQQILKKKLKNSKAVHCLFTECKKAYDTVRTEVLYNILLEFGVNMKLVRLVKMNLNETFSKVRAGNYLSDSLRHSLVSFTGIYPEPDQSSS
jgi:hypothetical protein